MDFYRETISQLKQKRTAAKWTSLTEEDRYDLKS